MSLVASSISGAAYVLGNNEEKDTGNGFEFTRRKKWPQLLLQELTSSALFCIKPVPGGRGSVGSSDGKGAQNMGWKILFVSPSVGEMLGTKPADIDGRDFLDYVLPDHPQLIAMFNSLIAPHLTHQPSHSSSGSSSTLNMGSSSNALPMTTSSASHTTYVRMNIPNASSPRGQGQGGPMKQHSGSSGSSSSNSNSNTNASGPGMAPSSGDSGASSPKTVVWEIRAHATGVEGQSDTPAFGLGGGGTMIPTTTTQGDDLKGKAVWVMGRRVGEGVGDESNGQSLDAFLELKLENEKLREELRELQSDFDEDDYQTATFPAEAQPQRQSYNLSPSTSPTPSSSSTSPPSSPAFAAQAQAQSQLPRPKAGPGRPPKDPATKEKDKEAAREKKRAKKNAASRAVGGAGAGNDGEGGMHVCVTCGRTDSPEWRKGPLGPKTLCNACGLRWAKRNSTAPTRKDKKIPGAPGTGK